MALMIGASCILAIDKKTSKKATVKAVEIADSLKAVDGQRLMPPPRNMPDSSSVKDYQDFIDRNNNGIDDRAEDRKKPSPPPDPEQKQPEQNDSTASEGENK
jgi:hypothetical protein